MAASNLSSTAAVRGRASRWQRPALSGASARDLQDR